MTIGSGAVGSVLTERPPSGDRPATGPHTSSPSKRYGAPPAPPPPAPSSWASSSLTPMSSPPSPEPLITVPGHRAATPASPAPALVPATSRANGAPSSPPASAAADGNQAWYDSLLGGRQYEVLYDDAQGYPLLGFLDGQWYDVTSPNPEPITVRHAIHLDPAWAGAVVQTVCMWMRSNPHHDRAFELATELALAVGELARLAT